jgi:hypothetical protein
MVSRRLAVLSLVSLLGFVGLSWVMPGQAEDAAVTVAIASVPPLERIRPNTDLARLTLTALLHGTPVTQGHMHVQLTAPPRTPVVSTGFPRVEGTPLLALDSALNQGSLTLQYVFPIRGTYTFDVELTPVSGGPVFPPTRVRKTVRIYEHPAVVRNAWLLMLGLFLLGGITGIIFARSAAARERLLTGAMIGPLLCLCGALVPVSSVYADADHTRTAAEAPPAHQVVRGDHGWELEVQASPVPATVGHLVQCAIWLRQNGEVFPGTMEVWLEVVNQEDDRTVLGTRLLTPQGYTSQSLQLYDGAPHTVTIAVRPVGGEEESIAPLTAVLDLDVVALHPPVAVQVRTMAILLGVLVLGMVVGFCVPRFSKEQAGA